MGTGASWGRRCGAALALCALLGCGSKSDGGAPSGSAKASGSAAAAPSGSSAGDAVAGKPRVPYEMSPDDACIDPRGGDGEGHGMISAEEDMWPNGSTIKVAFLNGDKEWIDEVVSAASEWMQYANLTFEWHKDPADVPADADELVTFKTKDCQGWYVLGAGPMSAKIAHKKHFSVCLEPWSRYIKNGKLADARVAVVHEFGHVIGLMHEQFNPNLKVHWDKEYLYDWCEKTQRWDHANCDHQIMMPLDKQQPDHHWRATAFDPDSIMFYGIKNPNWTLERVTFPEPKKISEMDKKTIGELYPKTTTKEPTDPVQAAQGYDLETQIRKLSLKDGKQNYAIAVGVAEASDRKKVESAIYIFPAELAPHPLPGDSKHEQFIVKGKISVDPAVKSFKVRGRIKLKDGTYATVDKELNLASADATGGSMTKDDE